MSRGSALHGEADELTQTTRLRFSPRWVRGKGRHAQYLYRLYRLSPDWLRILKFRMDIGKAPLSPLRFRNGTVLKHGKLDNPWGLLKEVFLDRSYDLDETPPPDAVMVDIGANIGAASLFWAARSPSLRIHAYEPNPSALEMLRANVKENRLQDRLEVFPEAVGLTEGHIDLWVNVRTDLSTAYLDRAPSEGGTQISVPMVEMGKVWERLGRRKIWLLKIDTEGAEGDILEGAPKPVLHAIQNAIVEYHDNICPGVSVRCWQVLTEAGFRCRERSYAWGDGLIYAYRTERVDVYETLMPPVAQ